MTDPKPFEWGPPGVGKAYHVPGLADITEDQKQFILAHENFHRRFQKLPEFKNWDDFILILEDNGE